MEKKQSALDVLALLKEVATEENPLAVTELSVLSGYDRKTVRLAIGALLDRGYPLCLSDKYKKKRAWYIKPCLTQEQRSALSQLLWLAPKPKEEYVQAFRGAISELLPDTGSSFSPICSGSCVKPEQNQKMMKIIETGLRYRKYLSFSLICYCHRNKAALQRDSEGQVIEYLVRPAGVLSSGGDFYLIGGIGDTGELRYFSFERMYDLHTTELDVPFMPVINENTLRLPGNRMECLHPTNRKKGKITVLATPKAVSAIWENFGKPYGFSFPESADGFRFFSGFNGTDEANGTNGFSELSKAGENRLKVSFFCDPENAKPFLLSLGAEAEVLSPPSLRRAVADEHRMAFAGYRAK